MTDTENLAPSSKKRAAGREISRDNPGLDDEGDAPEQVNGTFQRASDDVLATRKIVRVRRKQPAAASSTNPFANIQLLPPVTEPGVKPINVIGDTLPGGDKPIANEASEEKDGDIHFEKECSATEPNGKDGNDNQLEEKQIKQVGAELSIDDKRGSLKQATDTADIVEKGAATGGETVNEVEKDNGQNDTASSAIPLNSFPPGVELAADEKNESMEKATNTDGVVDKEAATGEETVEEVKRENGQNDRAPSASATPLNSFQQLSSSQNAFTGFAGTGFSSSSFSFGTSPNDRSSFGAGSGSPLIGQNDKPSSLPSFNFNSTNNGSSLFGTTSGAISIGISERSGLPSMQEMPVETGEENEKVVYNADSALFEYIDGKWKERGKGEVKVNVSTADDEKARLVMRAKGNYRLILNASLYPDMKLTDMDKRGIIFACMNSASEVKGGLSTFALKFNDGSIMEEFRAVVNLHKVGKTTAVNTPDKSPKGSDE